MEPLFLEHVDEASLPASSSAKSKFPRDLVIVSEGNYAFQLTNSENWRNSQ